VIASVLGCASRNTSAFQVDWRKHTNEQRLECHLMLSQVARIDPLGMSFVSFITTISITFCALSLRGADDFS
jgi:hypothetical protein